MHAEAEVTESGSCIQKRNFPTVQFVFSPQTSFFPPNLVFKQRCPPLLLPGVRLRTCRVLSALHLHPPALRRSSVYSLWTRPLLSTIPAHKPKHVAALKSPFVQTAKALPLPQQRGCNHIP